MCSRARACAVCLVGWDEALGLALPLTSEVCGGRQQLTKEPAKVMQPLSRLGSS